MDYSNLAELADEAQIILSNWGNQSILILQNYQEHFYKILNIFAKIADTVFTNNYEHSQFSDPIESPEKQQSFFHKKQAVGC